MKVIAMGNNSEKIMPCKCGTIPQVGDTFYFRSTMTGTLVVGVVKYTTPSSITSTKGAYYPKFEIEIKPLEVKREESLNNILNQLTF